MEDHFYQCTEPCDILQAMSQQRQRRLFTFLMDKNVSEGAAVGSHRFIFQNVMGFNQFRRELGEHFQPVMAALRLDPSPPPTITRHWRFRVNVYVNSQAYMFAHRDRHKEGAEVTTLLALGSKRTLRFKLDVPQELPWAGDNVGLRRTYDVESGAGRMIRFGWEANLLFTHEVVKEGGQSGPRITIVAWTSEV